MWIFSLFKVTKSRGSSVTHNSHNRNNGGGHKDSLKNDLAVFTGFKSALEACYLDWEEYTLPGITYTAGSNPMYHCPFTCFRHAGDTRTEVNQVSLSPIFLKFKLFKKEKEFNQNISNLKKKIKLL